MNKKGKIFGAIGWILALALTGGTFYFYKAFDPFQSAKYPMPVSFTQTGSFLGGYIGGDEGAQSDYDAIKSLVSQAKSLCTGSNSGELTSYTLRYTSNSIYDIEEDEVLQSESVSTIEWLFAVDENYTYVKMTESGYQGSDAMDSTLTEEVIYDKSANKYYVNASGAEDRIENVADIYFGAGDWQQESSLSSLGLLFDTLFEVALDDLTEGEGKFTREMLAGAYHYSDAEEGFEEYFTVGFLPVIYSGFKNGLQMNYTLRFSGINTTSVQLPAAEIFKGAN